MASIKKYATKDGKEFWRVQVFAGNDPQTGHKKYKVRRGFKTKKEATVAAARLELAISNGDLEKEKPKPGFFRMYMRSGMETTLIR